MQLTTDQINERLKRKYPAEHVDAVDDIMRLPSGSIERWRAAAALYLKLNPKDFDPLLGREITAKESAARAVKKAKLAREMHAGNPFATSEDKNSGLRWGVDMPIGIFNALKLFDPYAMDSRSGEHQGRLAKLIKAFPEFAVCEKL